MLQPIIELDRALFHAINSGLASPVMDVIMPLITDLGLSHVQVTILILAALAPAFLRRSSSEPLRFRCRQAFRSASPWFWSAILGIVLTGLAVQVVKRLPRKRPSWFYVHEQRAGRPPRVKVHTIAGRRPLRVNGFPSGHTATTASLAVTLAATLPTRRSRRIAGSALAIMTGLIGVSRVYMADHWPLDVVGGVVFGVVLGTLAVRITSQRIVRPAAESVGSSEGAV